MWADPQKSEEIFPWQRTPFGGADVYLGHDYRLNELPGTIYVEGLSAGTTELHLNVESSHEGAFEGTTSNEYVINNGAHGFVKDVVWVTPVSGDLTLEGVNDIEEATVGGIAFYNDNDSDENGIADILDDVGRTSVDEDWVTLQIAPIAPNTVGGTYTLEFPPDIRVWIENPDGTYEYIQSGISFDATNPIAPLYVEGFSENGDGNIVLNYDSPNGTFTVQADTVRVRSEPVVVEWAKIADEQNSDSFNKADGRLEHDKAIDKDQGAYILLNDDDDDYDDAADSGATQTLSDQENDLLPLYVHKMPKDKGNGDYTYTLFKSSALRLWVKNADGSYRPFLDDDLDFSEKDELEFFVDAKSDAGETRHVILRVEHPKAAKPFRQKIYTNIFEIQGPGNVPDYSVYEYRVDDFADRGGTTWVNPGFGQLREQDPTPNDNVDSARLFWNVSPKIAKARYQATVDYVWARDVNVVEIVLGDGSLNNSGQNPHLNFPGNEVVQAASAGNDRALESDYVVESMQGPTRGNNEERGVEKMLVGYMQTLAATVYNAQYAGNSNWHHAMQGFTYVDQLNNTQVPPWYDSAGFSSQFEAGKGLLTGEAYKNARNANPNAELKIAMSDSPFPFFLLRNPHPNMTGELQSATFLWEFELMVAVGTLEVDTETRPLPPGPRYPFFRRGVSQWQYTGTITRFGNQLNEVQLNGNGVEIVSPWEEENGGNLAFDTNVRRSVSNGEPITANSAINGGEGVIWVPDA